MATLDDIPTEPSNLQQALQSPEALQWKAALDSEYNPSFIIKLGNLLTDHQTDQWSTASGFFGENTILMALLLDIKPDWLLVALPNMKA